MPVNTGNILKNANVMKDLLESAGLEQHVHEPTHRRGHTLDLLITRTVDNLVSEVEVIRGLPSDHYAVKCNVPFSRPGPVKKSVCYRELRKIDVEQFQQDIKSSVLFTDPSEDPSGIISQYEHVLGDLLDRHAPVKTKILTLRPNTP